MFPLLQKNPETCSTRFGTILLYIKPEKCDIAILHDIVLTLDPGHSKFFGLDVRAGFHQLFIGCNLSPDKAPLNIGMDLSGCLRRFCALSDGPGACFLWPGSQEGDQAKQLVTRADNLIQPRGFKSQICQEQGFFLIVELSDLFLDLGGNFDDLTVIAGHLFF